jgi:hypothetical protein
LLIISLLIFFSLLLGIPSGSRQPSRLVDSSHKYIRVPWDYPTIRAAIDAAEDGDKNCIIDCENRGNTHGFHFHSGEGQDSIVDGFTLCLLAPCNVSEDAPGGKRFPIDKPASGASFDIDLPTVFGYECGFHVINPLP